MKSAPPSIKALLPYFKYYDSIIITAGLAGLTVVSVLLITMFISYFLLGFAVPVNSNYRLLNFLILAAPLGYIADQFIYKYQIFGKLLNPYYRIAGVGWWGMLAFVFSIIISYFISLLFVPFLFRVVEKL
jgi:hypothetical protein